jgi:hypothetical protein
MTKLETLSQARDARVAEVLYYQINIDNYTLAIEEIDRLQDAELSEFKQQLQSMLKSEILEQKKAKVLLTVIEKQLELLA